MLKEANYEDPFVVTVAKDELIVGRENFPEFAGSISVELLDMRLNENMLSFLNLSTRKFWMKKFSRKKFL